MMILSEERAIRNTSEKIQSPNKGSLAIEDYTKFKKKV